MGIPLLIVAAKISLGSKIDAVWLSPQQFALPVLSPLDQTVFPNR